jgi:hypothetical protein
MPQLRHAADSPLGALASCHPAQLAYVQERCRRYGDGMEVLVLAVFVRPVPCQNSRTVSELVFSAILKLLCGTR